MDEGLPVVVIGAGPVGLAAAAELVGRDLPVVVLERGDRAGAAVSEWGHVRLFSMWRDLVAPAAEKLLTAAGWTRPADGGYPTGAEWVDSYLAPLAAALGGRVRFGAEVTGVSRLGRDRVVDSGRAEQPFTVRVRTSGGEERLLARAVMDASGTWGSPNPAGGDGLPALGEADAAGRVSYRVPDTADPAGRARHAGRTTAVVGRGHSALTALVALAALAEEVPGTRAVWVLRRGAVGDAFGGGAADRLAGRGALGLRARAAVEAGHIEVVTGFRTAEVRPDGDRLVLVDDGGRALEPVDEVVALTGFRPDLSFLSEVRLGLDAALQAPVELAPLIDPNVHSCGTVYPHGAAELSHPEEGFFLAGMKSYGRAPTFLALTGFEQVRSIAAHLAGDREAAARVELTLPETGVCGGAGLFDDPGATKAGADGCCGPAPEAERPSPAAAGAGLLTVSPLPLLTAAPTASAGGGCCGGGDSPRPARAADPDRLP
ncbi:NAD(P)-binding domain-containing protein [Nocardiopsis changdeensis]|uniref:NAD(P)-binding domain-containing protein n=1 Tax=Nocardiopsis changdeensis TaxID=2831969 RepID=A0ABX8BXS2_9ACTN|nr:MULTISPECIES: NAD(P)-binding domain-containing protein [Nocardiopsis]QUX25133.1 NAD(P)-binding domain-containing protein [Nocardiopsis changdeensis]QYX35520.1 NAD(P)-binding domain-containing protein [Nocardiopsis sp. MT53]